MSVQLEMMLMIRADIPEANYGANVQVMPLSHGCVYHLISRGISPMDVLTIFFKW
jgi:hypothetical protein